MNIIPSGSRGGIFRRETASSAVYAGHAPEFTVEVAQALSAEMLRWMTSDFCRGIRIDRTKADLPNPGLDGDRGLYYIELLADQCTMVEGEGDDPVELLRSLIAKYVADPVESDPGFYLTPKPHPLAGLA